MHNPDQRYHAQITVEPRIDDQGLQRAIDIALRRRHFNNQLFQHILHAQTGFGADHQRLVRRNADHLFNFSQHTFRLGGWQIDFIQHRHYFQALLYRRIAIRHALRLNALRRIDHQQRAFTSRQRPGHFIRKIHMSRCINKIKLVSFAVFGFKVQGNALRLDGDASLFLNIHSIKDLRRHFTGT